MAQGLRIGIVQARFNADVCHGLLSACLAELKRLGVADEDMLHVTVPGALEIPLALQKMAETQQFDALIALGAVIRGETYHFELVANESGAGITRVGAGFRHPDRQRGADHREPTNRPRRAWPRRAPTPRGSRSRWRTWRSRWKNWHAEEE